LIPFLVLLSRDLSVLGCSIEAGMPQVLLEQSKTVTRIVHLGGVVAVAYSPLKLK